ncbi:hypothetical protein C0992_012230 [Termitomyces sp. T32_za158]|nr:hypothetical protein C0992_012230 [Termitomyces sp. T32_za158]
MASGISRQGLAILALAPIILTLRRLYLRSLTRRTLKVLKNEERVLVLGASSGIGESVAKQYAERGAAIGRTESPSRILGVVADFANAEDMVMLRETLQKEWQGVDTLIVTAGVSALQPLMDVAGVEANSCGTSFTPSHASIDGIKRAVNISAAAARGNYTGPLVAAVTFIPLLISSSPSPSILLVSSLGAVIPPPTRTLYASTKAASLVLYQALSIEHPSIAFTCVLPATVEGDFRASAVDAGRVREVDPNKHGLKRVDVARRCIEAVDAGERTVFMPSTMR